MINSSNLKDTLTTICGLVVAVGGSLLAIEGIPSNVKAIVGVAVAVSVGVIGWLTGKSPSGAQKTDSQVVAQNVTEPKPPATK